MDRTFTVGELSSGIARALARAYPDEVWVRGEIRDLARAPSEHVYFSLVDGDGDDTASRAMLPVTLFANDRRAVNLLLRRSGAVRMTDGVEVRIRGTVSLYAARGTIQFRMTWIDTDYTVSRLAASRDRLLRRLVAEGLVGRNASLPLPLVPLRIGLVTSLGSAAHADFLQELRQSGFAFEVTEVDARVQGSEAAASIVSAMETAVVGVDVVALVRGGGAATDLAAFDDEAVARAIAAAPVPVATGIGHEVDSSVADAVAALAFKTPTACAAGLVALVAEFLDSLRVLEGRLGRAGTGQLRRHREVAAVQRRRLLAASSVTVGGERAATAHRAQLLQYRGRFASTAASYRVEATGRAVASGAAGVVRPAAAELRRLATAVAPLAARATARVSHGLDVLETVVTGQDPARLLARGWSITLTGDGRLVRRVGAVEPGDRLITRLVDGRVGSVVVEGGEE